MMDTIEAWLRRELEHIQQDEALNGQLRGELFSCNEAEQEIVLSFPTQAWQANGLKTLHGGMLYTMMDLTMSIAVYAFSRQSIPPTVSMTVNYLRPVPLEGNVLLRTRLTSLGRRNATAYCEAIIPESGKLAGTAVGTYAIIRAN